MYACFFKQGMAARCFLSKQPATVNDPVAQRCSLVYLLKINQSKCEFVSCLIIVYFCHFNNDNGCDNFYDPLSFIYISSLQH